MPVMHFQMFHQVYGCLGGYKNIVTGAENLEIFESGNQICYRFNNVAHGTFGIQSYDNAGNMENHMYTR